MIWVILGLLVIPLWLIVIAIIWILWHHKDVKNGRGVFACKLRASSGDVPVLGEKFPRLSSYALWVHDVLLVYSPGDHHKVPQGPIRDCETAVRCGPATWVASGSHGRRRR